MLVIIPVSGRRKRPGQRWCTSFWHPQPLATPAREALEAHRTAQGQDRADFGKDYSNHDLVFCEATGVPLRPGAVTAAFERHVADCGLPTIRLHDARHGACSLMLAGGVPIEVVQMILGHSSPAVTRQVYAHVMRQATAELIDTATDLLTRHRRRG